MKRTKTVGNETEETAGRTVKRRSGSSARRVTRGSESTQRDATEAKAPAGEATKKGRGGVRVDRRFATVAVREFLVAKGFWNSAKSAWTEAAAALLDMGSLVSERLDEATREELRAVSASDAGGRKPEQKAAPTKRVFRLTDAERSQIVGEMIKSLRGKIGAKGRSVTAEMIKLLQLERELTPPPAAASKPKRVTVVFVPPKDVDKYVMRKDAPVAEPVEEQE